MCPQTCTGGLKKFRKVGCIASNADVSEIENAIIFNKKIINLLGFSFASVN